MADEELMHFARKSARRMSWSRRQGTGPDAGVNFAAGGVATPADAALMMQLGVDGVFVGFWYSSSPATRPSAPRHCQSRDPLQ